VRSDQWNDLCIPVSKFSCRGCQLFKVCKCVITKNTVERMEIKEMLVGIMFTLVASLLPAKCAAKNVKCVCKLQMSSANVKCI